MFFCSVRGVASTAQSVLFQKSAGVLADGAYLPGHYRWPVARRLTEAFVECNPPRSGQLTLTLEVGGIPTDLVIPIGGSTAPGDAAAFSARLVLDYPLAADTRIRWKAAYEGPPEDGATRICLRVDSGLESQFVSRTPVLGVRWVFDQERLDLFSYHCATHTFTALAAAAGRARLRNLGPDDSFVFEIGKLDARTLAGGQVSSGEANKAEPGSDGELALTQIASVGAETFYVFNGAFQEGSLRDGTELRQPAAAALEVRLEPPIAYEDVLALGYEQVSNVHVYVESDAFGIEEEYTNGYDFTVNAERGTITVPPLTATQNSQLPTIGAPKRMLVVFDCAEVANPRIPRIEFTVDGAPLAVLNQNGILRVPRFTQAAPSALAPGAHGADRRFEFYSNGGLLTAVLDSAGLTSRNFVEATL